MTQTITYKKNKFYRILSVFLALMMIISVLPLSVIASDDVDFAVVCNLSPRKTTYYSGETIQFSINAQYAASGNDETVDCIKIGIPVPDTSPKVQLPMFSQTGTEEGYEGIPMYPLYFQGNTVNLYLVTLPDGKRRIEFTLLAGDTLQGNLSMTLPNGITEPISQFTLVPEILSENLYDKTELNGGTTSIKASFGWNDVNLVSSTNNLGIIGNATRDPESISYTVTADSKENNISSGAIFTEHYKLTQNINLNGLHYPDGELTLAEDGGFTSAYIDGQLIFQVEKPLSKLKIDKIVENGYISGLTYTYTDTNDNINLSSEAAEALPNLRINSTLFLKNMQLNDSHGITNAVATVTFDAYSPFYDEDADKTDSDYHSHSQATNTAYTIDNYHITKNVYEDSDCTDPLESNEPMEDGMYYYYKINASNESVNNGVFQISDILPDGLTYISDENSQNIIPASDGKKIIWDNVPITTGNSYTIIVKVKFEISKLSSGDALHNVANLTSYTVGLIATASVDSAFRAGNTKDADISYEKSPKQSAAGVGDPLDYTIKVTNQNKKASKYITVQDNWPGDQIKPISASVGSNSSCSDIVVIDEQGIEHSLDNYNNAVIKKIQFRGLFIPAGATVTLTIKGQVTNEFDELINTVQTGTGDAGSITNSLPAYGVSLHKDAYLYNVDTSTISDKPLTINDVVDAENKVCYKITVKNLKNSPLNRVTLTDKLPAGVNLIDAAYKNVSSKILIERADGTVNPISISENATAHSCTTAPFNLGAKETVTFYLFCNVTEQAITESQKNKNCVTNAAFVAFNGITTSDATANFYTYVEKTKKFHIAKNVMFIADYSDDMKYQSAGPVDWALGEGNDQPSKTNAWKGATVGYQLILVNKTQNQDKLSVYEVDDILPEGMEFVGVLTNGNYDYLSKVHENRMDLSDVLIKNGESAIWRGTSSYYPNEAKISCQYDKTTRRIRIIINDGDVTNPLNVYYDPGVPASRAYFYVIAKVTGSQSTYTNYTEAKVDTDVELNTPKTNTSRIEGAYKYIGTTNTTKSCTLVPGINKKLVGHYYPDGALNTDNSTIDPSELLRFQIQLKNQDNSTNYNKSDQSTIADPTASYLMNYTVTDILPQEYNYKPGSARLLLNRTYNTSTGEQTNVSPMLHKEPDAITPDDDPAIEPEVVQLDDGRTKLIWTLTGKQYRILNVFYNTNKPQYESTGFMNIITYDVEWNSDFAYSYGNYTNIAAVKHSYDFSSVSTGSPDYSEHTIMATTVVNVFGASGTKSYKTVTNSKKQTATGSDADNDANRVEINPGETVRYSLNVQNSTADHDIGSLTFIDELPREKKDTGIVNRSDRKSEFSVFFNENPNLEVKIKDSDDNITDIDPSQYTVRYGMSVGAGLKSRGDWNGNSGGYINWKKDSDGMNAVKITFNADFTFSSYQTIIISFDAQAASQLSDGNQIAPGSTAWNSFGYTYKAIAKENEEPFSPIYSEPQKVGINIPGAKLSVTKSVTGNFAPKDKPFTFTLKQNNSPISDVKYITSGKSKAMYTDKNGQFTLSAGETATFYVALGSGYTVTENEDTIPTDFELANISPDYLENGAVSDSNKYMFEFADMTVNDDIAGVTFVNSYSQPVSTELSLYVIKEIAENPLPAPCTFTFTLKRTDNGYASDVTMPDISRQTVSTSLSSGKSEPVNFGKITFNCAGTYKFEISEFNSNINGMVYAEPKVVNVTVTQAGRLLVAKITDNDGNEITQRNILTFVNTYKPAQAAAQISIAKKLEGDILPVESDFEFELALKDGDKENVIMPAETKVKTNKILSGSCDEVYFDKISFTAAGTYIFSVSELTDNMSGMTYAKPQDVTVVVTDNDGALNANISDINGKLTFINSYKADDSSSSQSSSDSSLVSSSDSSSLSSSDSSLVSSFDDSSAKSNSDSSTKSKDDLITPSQSNPNTGINIDSFVYLILSVLLAGIIIIKKRK